MTRFFNILALIAVCATAVMHWFGVESSLYWTLTWWDIPTHMLGGLTAGAWVAAVATRYEMSTRRAIFLIIGFTLAVGVSWEIWEALEGLSGGPLDTIKDVIDDAIGAAVVACIYRVYNKTRR